MAAADGSTPADYPRRVSRRRPHRAPAPPGSRLVAGGTLLFLVGVVAILATIVPFFFGHRNQPLALNLTAVAAPVGMGIALAGLVRQARTRTRGRRRATSADAG